MRLECAQCEEVFHKKCHLKKHMLEQHDDGWFRCVDHCGKKFRFKKMLDAHIQRVEEINAIKNDQMYSFTCSVKKFGSILQMNPTNNECLPESND